MSYPSRDDVQPSSGLLSGSSRAATGTEYLRPGLYRAFGVRPIVGVVFAIIACSVEWGVSIFDWPSGVFLRNYWYGLTAGYHRMLTHARSRCTLGEDCPHGLAVRWASRAASTLGCEPSSHHASRIGSVTALAVCL